MQDRNKTSASMSGQESRELRSFGRRRGRALSPRQQGLLQDVLPEVQLDFATPAPTPLTSLFKAPICEVWLEIGFGGAEHLLWQAQNNPTAGLIGCEPFEEGVVKALSAIDQNALSNIRLHPDDARDILRWLPATSIDRAFVLFPDPWPKRRHMKRRLVNTGLLGGLARVMRPGAELRIATDIGDYLRTILIAFREQQALSWTCKGPAQWRQRPADWPPTRYEQKAGREGRRCYYLSFVRGE